MREGSSACRGLFDAAVRLSPAASVALYSLGDEALSRLPPTRSWASSTGWASWPTGPPPARPRLRDRPLRAGAHRWLALRHRHRHLTRHDRGRPRPVRRAPQCPSPVSGRDLAPIPDRAASMPSSRSTRSPISTRPAVRARPGAAPGDRSRPAGAGRPRDPESFLPRRSRARPLGRRGIQRSLGFELLRDGTSDLRTWDGTTFHFRKPLTAPAAARTVGRSSLPSRTCRPRGRAGSGTRAQPSSMARRMA